MFFLHIISFIAFLINLHDLVGLVVFALLEGRMVAHRLIIWQRA